MVKPAVHAPAQVTNSCPHTRLSVLQFRILVIFRFSLSLLRCIIRCLPRTEVDPSRRSLYEYMPIVLFFSQELAPRDSKDFKRQHDASQDANDKVNSYLCVLSSIKCSPFYRTMRLQYTSVRVSSLKWSVTDISLYCSHMRLGIQADANVAPSQETKRDRMRGGDSAPASSIQPATPQQRTVCV